MRLDLKLNKSMLKKEGRKEPGWGFLHPVNQRAKCPMVTYNYRIVSRVNMPKNTQTNNSLLLVRACVCVCVCVCVRERDRLSELCLASHIK